MIDADNEEIGAGVRDGCRTVMRTKTGAIGKDARVTVTMPLELDGIEFAVTVATMADYRAADADALR